jgi:NAD(P)-dependent dehydrogenase (short-subunit alcohol dehydrogenase family)
MNAASPTIPQTVLITGCSSGIGRAAALRFAEAGWNVVATMRDVSQAGELAAQPNLLVQQLDVTDRGLVNAAVDATLARFGRIDALVNNAGFGCFGPFELADDTLIERQLATYVLGVFNLTRAVLPTLRSQASGVVINVASIGGLTTIPFFSVYHATKYAVVGFTEALNHELADFGIRAKFVAPGAVATDFSGRSLSLTFTGDNHPYATAIAKVIAARANRRGSRSSPEQIADVIFASATDGTRQVRYVFGADAEALLAARASLDDAGYLQMMRQNIGLEPLPAV